MSPVWSSLDGSRILLNLLINAFHIKGELVIGFDDTIQMRWGKKTAAMIGQSDSKDKTLFDGGIFDRSYGRSRFVRERKTENKQGKMV